jgi:hypothetical protein
LLRDGTPLPWISGTSAKGSGIVGAMPDHSMTLVLTTIRHVDLVAVEPGVNSAALASIPLLIYWAALSGA